MTDERLELTLTVERPRAEGQRLDLALGVFKVVYGIFVLLPESSMDGPNFQILLGWASETQWGVAILLVGVVQLFANRIDCQTGWKPMARVATNYLGGVVWGVVAMGFAAANPWSTAVVNYACLAMAHGFCAVRAARDVTQQAMAHYGR